MLKLLRWSVGLPALSRPWALAVTLAFLLAAVFLRAAIDPLLSGRATFATYYVAVFFTTLLLGGGWGSLLVLLSLIANHILFTTPARLESGLHFADFLVAALFAVAAVLIVLPTNLLRRQTRELDQLIARRAALHDELQHRVQNNLAIAQSLITLAFRPGVDHAAALEDAKARLVALGRANEVLRTGDWSLGEMPQLASAALLPFGDAIALAGPPCALPAKACVPLVLALHELATNAVKHGALSTGTGRVEVRWSLSGARMDLLWTEHGGPAVSPPTRQGLGSRLLRAHGPLETVRLEYLPGGVVCRIAVDGASSLSAAA